MQSSVDAGPHARSYYSDAFNTYASYAGGVSTGRCTARVRPTRSRSSTLTCGTTSPDSAGVSAAYGYDLGTTVLQNP